MAIKNAGIPRQHFTPLRQTLRTLPIPTSTQKTQLVTAMMSAPRTAAAPVVKASVPKPATPRAIGAAPGTWRPGPQNESKLGSYFGMNKPTINQ